MYIVSKIKILRRVVNFRTFARSFRERFIDASAVGQSAMVTVTVLRRLSGHETTTQSTKSSKLAEDTVFNRS